jgi:glycine cleavage system aminomethyltransferase T
MTDPVRGPLDDLVRAAGATMVVRDGRWVAAHYGSRAGEVAACKRAVGIADRFDRATLEISGDPSAVDRVVEAVTHRPASHADAVRAGHAWWCRITPERVVLRCEAAYADPCREAVAAAAGAEPDAEWSDLSAEFTAIEVIGRRAEKLMREAGIEDDAMPLVLHESRDTWEIVSEPAVARELWTRLHSAGRSLEAVSVGLDALDMLAAGEHQDAVKPA